MFVGPVPIALQAARGRAGTLRAVGDAIARWPITIVGNAGTATGGEMLAGAGILTSGVEPDRRCAVSVQPMPGVPMIEV